MSLRDMEELRLSSPQHVEDAFAWFPSTVAGLAAEVDGDLIGMVASTFTAGISFDPAMAMVSIRRGSSTWQRLRESGRLGVSIFADGQTDVVSQLASRHRDRFADRELLRTSSGVYFSGAAIWVGVRLTDEIPAGDHIVALLEIDGIGVNDSAGPLIAVNRTMSRLASGRNATGREQPRSPASAPAVRPPPTDSGHRQS